MFGVTTDARLISSSLKYVHARRIQRQLRPAGAQLNHRVQYYVRNVHGVEKLAHCGRVRAAAQHANFDGRDLHVFGQRVEP